ncbi:carboxypeptidase-like regulatory domain-containing protein [Chloroflexota bacterium]
MDFLKSQESTIRESLPQPNSYDGKIVTLDAFYFYAVLESNALADSVGLDNSDEGKVLPVGAQVRVMGNISQELQNQLYTQESPSPTNTEYFGKLRITGKFEIDDKDSQYQIDITKAEVLEYMPPPAGTSTPGGNLQIKIEESSSKVLQGAKVVSSKQPDGQPKLSGLTDSNGKITLDDIKQGGYEVTVSLPDYIQMDIRLAVTGGRTASVAL